ncbi:MAG TPA: hypothetical protein PLN21_20340 [Gemmatales bacterium]|nr:hypothetical protein [Gemmatales bacterium]
MDWLNRESLTWFLLRITPSLFEWAMILLPLTLYLLWLGFEVGRKKQPYVLSGWLDTLLLILGLSGFILLGPATWLIARYAQAGWTTYLLAYGIYLLVVICLCIWWMGGRRQSLVVYNIDPNAFQLAFRPILDGLGIAYQMTPGRIALEGQRLVLDMEATPSLFCVTVEWAGDVALWKKIEPPLRAALGTIATERNPAGTIIPLYASLMLCFTSLSTVMFIWYCLNMF